METKLNKSDFILLGVVIVVTSIINIWQYYVQENDLLEYLIDIPAYILMTSVAIGLFMYWLLPNFLKGRPNYFLLIGLAIIILTATGFLEYVMGFWSGNNDWNKFPIWHICLLESLFIGADNIGIPLGILLTKKFYEGQTQVVKIQKQQKENELKLLRSQLDPHFLFNNLNTLDALIDSNPTNAKEYINRLALIYRYLIQTKDAEIMELNKEIELAENYIFLIKTRFGTDYNFQIKCNTKLDDKYLPTGAIQTLLENVVKHNKTVNKKTIYTSIEIEDDCIAITNTKSKLAANSDSLGTGITNLKLRYEHLSNEQISVTETSETYAIRIPVLKLAPA